MPGRPPVHSATLIATLLTFGLLAALPVQVQAQTLMVLYTFMGPPKDGEAPYGPLVRDKAGNLYGVTVVGGSGNCDTQAGCGMAFALNSAGKALGTFSFNGKDGQEPDGGLLRDSAGNFYGTTSGGGDATEACGGPDGPGCGVAYQLSKAGKEVFYKFQGTPDGWEPGALLTEDAEGNLYGTTYLGGASNSGTVFKIDRAGQESVLYSFTGGSDGCLPVQGVVLDGAGNLYGSTTEGGAGFCNSGYGTVYELDTAGNLSVLYTFNVGDGANPGSALLLNEGNLYGTTQAGGTSQDCGFSGCGVVFELSPQQGGGWSESVLYNFCSLPECADGEEPRVGPLLMDAAGNLYGATYFGGAHRSCNEEGCGTIFEIDAAGIEQVLYSFTGASDGALPQTGLVMGDSGNLYGTTEEGGDTSCYPPYGCGVVFELTP